MRPKSRAHEQDDLRRPRLTDMIDMRHELVRPLSIQRPYWSDAVTYARLFGQDWATTEVPSAYVRDLTAYAELGFSRSKAKRLRLLRERLRKALAGGQGGGGIVYVSRGASGKGREMTNAEEVAKAFAARGIRVVEPEQGGTELIEPLLYADMIIVVEGSQASHGVYTLAERVAALTLQPPARIQ